MLRQARDGIFNFSSLYRPRGSAIVPLSFRIQMSLENNEDENWESKDYPVIMYKWDVSGIISFSSSINFRESLSGCDSPALAMQAGRKRASRRESFISDRTR